MSLDTIIIKGNKFGAFNKSIILEKKREKGNALKDYEILMFLHEFEHGAIFKVRSKVNNKIYAMKVKMNLIKTWAKAEKDEKDIQAEKAKQSFHEEILCLKKLSNPHILKYYHNFFEGISKDKENLYIIVQYLNNGNLYDLVQARKEKKKYFTEEELIDVFFQCMKALFYLHSQGLVHRNINLKSFLIDNYMKIHLGNLGMAPFKKEKEKEEKLYDESVGKDYLKIKSLLQDVKKVDVKSMGRLFYEMMYFHSPDKKVDEDKNIEYSQKLTDIVASMLQEDIEERGTSENILKEIKELYFQNSKNTSISSLITCLNCFDFLKENLDGKNKKNGKNESITESYKKCLDNITKRQNDTEKWKESIFDFRESLGKENLKLEGMKEIDPTFAFSFIIDKLHDELNEEKELESDGKQGPHLIITEEEKIDENEIKNKYLNYSEKNFNSPITKNLSGLMKIRNKCNDCQTNTFNFNYYFYIIYDLKKISEKKKIEEFLNNEYFYDKDDNIFCGKCLTKTSHDVFKQIETLPNLLVISIYRGNDYECKKKVDIKKNIKIQDFEKNTKEYQLVSLLKRIEKNDEEAYYISNYCRDEKWFSTTKDEKVKEVTNIENDDGDVILLFYQLKKKIN